MSVALLSEPQPLQHHHHPNWYLPRSPKKQNTSHHNLIDILPGCKWINALIIIVVQHSAENKQLEKDPQGQGLLEALQVPFFSSKFSFILFDCLFVCLFLCLFQMFTNKSSFYYCFFVALVITARPGDWPWLVALGYRNNQVSQSLFESNGKSFL